MQLQDTVLLLAMQGLLAIPELGRSAGNNDKAIPSMSCSFKKYRCARKLGSRMPLKPAPQHPLSTLPAQLYMHSIGWTCSGTRGRWNCRAQRLDCRLSGLAIP